MLLEYHATTHCPYGEITKKPPVPSVKVALVDTPLQCQAARCRSNGGSYRVSDRYLLARSRRQWSSSRTWKHPDIANGPAATIMLPGRPNLTDPNTISRLTIMTPGWVSRRSKHKYGMDDLPGCIPADCSGLTA